MTIHDAGKASINFRQIVVRDVAVAFRSAGKGLFRKGVVRFSRWKPREPRKLREARDEILKTTFSAP